MKPTFITPQHPKACIKPDRAAIARVLAAGFVGQRKVNGHRAQVHLSATGKLVAYTRQGSLHTSQFLPDTQLSLLRIFQPAQGWTVIDVEWQKQEKKSYVFDILKLEDRHLSQLPFAERHEILRKFFSLDRFVEFLPLLKTADACMQMLEDKSPMTEGLVFKSLSSPGFNDTSIIRCRKNGILFVPEKLSEEKI